MMMLLKRAERVGGWPATIGNDVQRHLKSQVIDNRSTDRLTHLIQCHVLSADCPYCEKGQQTESLRRARLSTIGQTLLSSSAVAMPMAIGADSACASVPLLVASAATSSHNSLLYRPLVVTAKLK